MPMAGRWPISISARPALPCTITKGRSRRSSRPKKPATTATTVRWRSPRAHRYNKHAAKALEVLDKLSGAVEQTAEYLYQRGATVASLGGNPDGSGRPVRAGRRSRWHVMPGLCSAWRSRTTAAATTTRPFDSTSGRPARSRPTSARSSTWASCTKTASSSTGLSFATSGSSIRSPIIRAPGCISKDASASGNMLFDEEAQRRNDRLAQVLNVPVTDFELSVRSRNCLQKMGIRTLGDLTRSTRSGTAGEQEFWRDLARRNPRHAALARGWSWVSSPPKRPPPSRPSI